MNEAATPTVVGICGSMRDESRTRVAMEHALEAAGNAGANTELIDLRELHLPPLKSTDERVPDAESLRAAVAAADAVLLGTPNYHGSYSGVLKNALDYCGRDEFEGTIVGLLEVAAGRFPGPALIHLRQVCRVLNAWTLPVEVAIPRSHSTITGGTVMADDIRERLHELGRQLAAPPVEGQAETNTAVN